MAANLPKKLGDLIDRAYAARAARLSYQAEVDEKIEALKAKERELNDAIINGFSAQDIEGAKGRAASASVSQEILPQAKDWPAIWKWVKTNDAFDLFERRIARVAYRDRVEAGLVIPGIETFVNKKLSLTKINGK